MAGNGKDDSLERYFTQTFESKLLVQVPQEDTKLTPATRLLAKKREMADVEVELVDAKERFALRMEKLKHRQEKLSANENKLSQSLHEYDKYLRENDLRRKRALKKAKDERAECEALDRDISQLKYNIKYLRNDVEEQRENLSQREVYEKYLKSVLAISHEFNEISELIDRHTTLSITNKELVDIQNENQKKLESINLQQERGKEAHQLEMLRLNNKLVGLEAKYESVTTERLYWENQAKMAENGATNRTLLLGRIKMATANLYALVERRGRAGDEKVASTDKQLDKVKVFIEDQQDVYREYEQSLLEEQQ